MSLLSSPIVQTLIGASVGTLFSLLITHIYYRFSSKEFRHEIGLLKAEIVKLKAISGEMQEAVNDSQRTSEDTNDFIKKGTSSDPEYPFK